MRSASLLAGPALNGLASSHLAPSCGRLLVSTDCGVTSPCAMTAATPHVKSGKAIALAQTRQQRVPAYANVPTMAESGFPGFEATTWYGLAGPAKMPLAMAKRMNEDINKVMLMPDVMEKLAASGAQDGGGSTEKFGDFMRAEQIKWARIIKEGGVKGEA